MKKTKETVFVFCAHSDDQVIGPGATLAKYAREGRDIYTFIFSFGEKSHPWLKREAIIKMRVKEAKKADKIIGGKGVYFLNLSEGKFSSQIKEKDIINKLKHFVEKHNPSAIFTHTFDDPHPDHRAVHNATLELVDGMDKGISVYAFDVWNPLNIRKRHLPKLYVDVSRTFKIKIKALKAFESQTLSLWTLLWSLYLRAILHGIESHSKYAERFFKVR